MSWFGGVSEEKRLIKKRAEPAPVEPRLAEAQSDASVSWLWRLWYGLQGYAIEDIERMKEAGVQMVESKATEARVKNKKVDAEASKIYMEAEVLKQQAAREQMKTDAEYLEIEEGRLELDERQLELDERRAEAAERQAEAWERMQRALEVIRLKGGDVYLSGKQIEEGVKRLGPEPEREESAESEASASSER